MADKLDALLNFHETALRLRAQRQELLAANIANADTPNYKARDIDFASQMKNALAAQQPVANGLQKTDPQHLGGQAGSAGSGETLFRPLIQGKVDGNTVDMDVERNQFTDNALRYEASLIMVNGQIRNMINALQN